MNDRIFIRGAMSGMAMAAAAAAVLAAPGPSEGYRALHPMFEPKAKRRHKQADRSKKQYLLKGIRP